jgi:hypothetical protein
MWRSDTSKNLKAKSKRGARIGAPFCCISCGLGKIELRDLCDDLRCAELKSEYFVGGDDQAQREDCDDDFADGADCERT